MKRENQSNTEKHFLNLDIKISKNNYIKSSLQESLPSFYNEEISYLYNNMPSETIYTSSETEFLNIASNISGLENSKTYEVRQSSA